MPARRWFALRGSVHVGRDLHIGAGTRIEPPHRLLIGDHVYIGRHVTVECDGEIGSNVLIANNVGLIGRYDHDHRMIGRAIRTAPWIGSADYRGLGRDLELVIEDDVWVGFGAIVLTGVRIHRGAIVAAGSIVMTDVEPYTIVAGQPARPVGMRFGPTEIDAHERLLYGESRS